MGANSPADSTRPCRLGRVWSTLLTLLPVIVLILDATPAASAYLNQQGEAPQPRRFTLYGDLKLDWLPDATGSRRLQLTLEDEFGRVVGSMPIGNDLGYRFSGLRTGRYRVILRDGIEELGRLTIVLDELSRSEMRQDLFIVQKDTASPAGLETAGVVYARPPAHQGYWREAARAADKGRPKVVVKLLQQITSQDPADFEAWTEEGTAHFQLKQWDQAEAAWLRAVEARPDYFRAWLNLGKLQFSRKDFEGAIETLKQAVQLRPSSAEAHYFLGECYLSVQLGSKAVPHLEEAIRLKPQAMAETHLRLAQLYHGAGAQHWAAEEYRKFLEKKPRDKRRKAIQEYVRKYGRPLKP